MQRTHFTAGYTLYNCVCDKYIFFILFFMYGKVVQIKLFLAMHITNKKIGFDIYTV